MNREPRLSARLRMGGEADVIGSIGVHGRPSREKASRPARTLAHFASSLRKSVPEAVYRACLMRRTTYNIASQITGRYLNRGRPSDLAGVPLSLNTRRPHLLCTEERAGRPRPLCNTGGAVDCFGERAQCFGHSLVSHSRYDERGCFRRPLEPGLLLFQLLRRYGIRLAESDDLAFTLQAVAIGCEFVAYCLVGLPGMLASAINEMQENATALHMAQEAVPEPGPLMGTLDQTRDVREHESAVVPRDNAELGVQRCERIVRDFRLGGAHARQERGLPGVG